MSRYEKASMRKEPKKKRKASSLKHVVAGEAEMTAHRLFHIRLLYWPESLAENIARLKAPSLRGVIGA